MRRYARGDWEGVVAAMMAARSETEMQRAASDIADLALPGGQAVDSGAERLVELLGQPGVVTGRRGAWLLGALDKIGQHIATCRRSNASGQAEEAEVERALWKFWRDRLDLLEDPDDEIRCLMCLVVGSAGSPTDSFDVLERHWTVEQSPLVREYVAQGMMRAVARAVGGVSVTGPATTAMAPELGSRMRVALAEAPEKVWSRAGWEIGGWMYLRDRLEELTGAPDLLGPADFWPSEEILT